MLKRGFSFAPGYRLESFLGRGQFGQVWRATAPGGAVAAVKFIDLSGGEGAKEHEGIKRVKQIRHANLMPITAIWLLDGQGKAIEDAPHVAEETISLRPQYDPLATADSLPPLSSPHVSQPGPLEATGLVVTPQEEPAWLAVAMLLGGKSLQQRLRECVKNGLPGIPPKELISYMDESAKGLDFLNIAQHDLGEGMVAIQHCDVKPANIVLLGSSAVVCDFGLARILSRNQVTATSAAGTPAYMAPEAIAGRPCKTSDQYSLAVTYYHLRTGTLPIADGTLWEVLDAHKTGKLDLSRVPEHEQAVLKRATALAWEQRFESNCDFVESLREALRVEGHTRPVLMPASVSLASPGTMPTSAIDPSITLMPGMDMTPPVASSAIDSAGPTIALVTSGDTKNDSAIQSAAQVPATAAGASARTTTAGDALWWTQPKWLASGAAVLLVPLLLITAINLSRDENAGASPGEGNGANHDRPSEPIAPIAVKSADEWLTQAAATFVRDEDAARAQFEAAVAIDPSLLTPVPTLLSGHLNAVMQVAFSEDGKHLISIADNPAPFAWAVGKLAGELIGKSGFAVEKVDCGGVDQIVTDLAVDPFGTSVAYADQAGNVAWTSFANPANPNKSWKLQHGEPISLAWHPDSSALLIATDFEPGIVVAESSAEADQAPYRFEVASTIKRIAMDPLGKWLVVLGIDGAVSKLAWSEIQAAKQSAGAPAVVPLSSQATRVSAMTVAKGASPSESVAITGGELGELTVWPLESGGKQQRQTTLHSQNVSAIAISAQGLQGPIASGDDGGVIGVWQPHESLAVKQSAHSASISSLDLSYDGRWLAAASLDGDVTLWDLNSREMAMVRLKMANAGPARSVRMDRGGRWLAVGHADGVVALWDLRHAQLLVGKELARGGQPAPADKKQQQEKQRAKERLAVPVT